MLLGPVLAAVTITVSDVTGAEARSTLGDSEAVAIDLYTAPAARGTVAFRRSQLSFGYSPRFAWVGVQDGDPEFALMHGADITYDWWTRRLRLSLSVAGSVGSQSYLNAARELASANAPTPAPGADPSAPEAEPPAATFFPSSEVITTGSVSPSLSAFYTFNQRWQAGLGVSYVLSGGLGDSREIVPFRRGPQAFASVSHQLTRRDSLSTGLSGSVTDVPRLDNRFITISLMQSWSHAFTERTRGTLSAGASYLRARTADGPAENSVLAAGGAGVTHATDWVSDGSLGFSADAQLGTSYNPLLGTVDQVASATAGASYAKGAFSLGLSAAVSQTLPVTEEDSAFAVGAGLSSGYQLFELMGLSAGVAWSRQILPNSLVTAAPHADQWSAFAAVSIAAPPLSF